MDQLLAFLQTAFSPIWIGVALLANVALDLVAARRLFRGYVFVTHVDKARRAAPTQRLTKVQWLLSWDAGIGAALWDFYCQASYSKYFLDLPRESTLSKRLTRYLEGPDCRNKRVAEFIRDETGIDFFDYRGKHL